MPYTLNRTDQSVLLTLADGTKDDTKTSLTFIGKNFNNYGEAFNENFLKLLEHFASDIPPSAPILGQLWYDKSARILKVYQGPIETWRVVPTANNVVGTTNQISTVPTSSGVQLSLPQNIHNQATPTFRNLTLTENLVGAPPLTISSTALVTNLNADLLDGKQGSEYSDYTKLTNKPTLGTISSLSTVTLGTNTTGNYVKSITGENGVVIENGSGAGSEPKVRHAATSTIPPVVASGLSGYQFVKNISFKYDSYGHATETVITGGSESNSFKTLVPFNSIPTEGYTWVNENSEIGAENKRVVAGNPEETLEVFGGGAIDVKVDNAKKAILIEHTDTSTVQSTNNLNGNVIRNITVDGYGHITALTSIDLDQRYLPKTGGTLTGGLTLNADPTTNLGAATKQYVDSRNNIVGYAIFDATTGAIFNNLQKNVTITRFAAGGYRVNLNVGIQTGNIDYIPIVSVVGNNDVFDYSVETQNINLVAANINTQQSTYFDIRLTRTSGLRIVHAQDDVDTSTVFYRYFADGVSGDNYIRVIIVR